MNIENIKATIKAALPKDWKATISVKNDCRYGTVTVTVRKMPKADFLAMGYSDINSYYRANLRRLARQFATDEINRKLHANWLPENANVQDHLTEWESFYDANSLSTQSSLDGFLEMFDVNNAETIQKIGSLVKAIQCENYNNNDSMTDYFDFGYLANLNFGTMDKPCLLV